MRRYWTTCLLVLAAFCFNGLLDWTVLAERTPDGDAPRVIATATVARDDANATSPANAVPEQRIRAARLPWLRDTAAADGRPNGFYA